MKREGRIQLNKKCTVAITAVVTAVSVAITAVMGYQVLPQTQPMKTYAKESFGGIKQIVREHGEDKPYIILDIVPGKGTYNDTYDISIGTMGYLVSGQAPIEKDLEKIFTKTPQDFYEYDARIDLADAVMPNFADSFIKVAYEEAYEGTGEDLSSPNGWIKILDRVTDMEPADGSKPEVPKGQMLAKWEKWQEGESTEGFDFLPADGSPEPIGAAEGDFYEADKDGIYQVTFENPQENTSGYQVVDVNEDWKNSTDATSVYRLVDGKYYYAGTVKELKTSLGIYSEEEAEGEEKKDKEEDKKTDTELSPEGKEEEERKDTDTDDVQGGNDGTDTGDKQDGNDGTDTSNHLDGNENTQSKDGNDKAEDGLTVSAASFADKNNAEWILLVEGDGSDNSGSGSDDSGSGSDNSGSGNDDSGSGSDNSGSGSDDSGSGSDNSGSGSDNSGSGNDDSGSGSDNSGNGNDDSGSGSDSSGSENDNNGNSNDVSKENDGSVYCIVTFSYVQDLEDAQELYEVGEVTEYEVEDGEAAPEDTYSKNGVEENEIELEAAGFSTGSAVKYSFVYAGPGEGTYKLTRVQESADKETEEPKQTDKEESGEEPEVTGRATSEDDVDGAEYVEVQNVTVYMRCCKGNDWLERYVFNSLENQDNSYDEFGIEVRCVPAAEVDGAMINDANLIFLEDGINPYLNTDISVKYSGVMSSDVIAVALYGAVADLKPVIVDYGIIEDEEHYQDDDTYQRFATAFLKKDLATFYYEMDQGGNLVENILINAKDSKDHPNKSDNVYNYVNRNIYIINNEELVSEDFAQPFDDDKVKGGFAEIIAAIKEENKTLSEDDKLDEDVSKAMAMQYIINFSVGMIGDFRDLTILELQPTANVKPDLRSTIRNEGSKRENVVLYWEREGGGESGKQILRSSKKIEIEVRVKSVAEFNGEYEDINSTYDMIFIGLDGQNLNREEDRNAKTIYNNHDLTGKVYHGGDWVSGHEDISYDASDITAWKQKALLEYLDAGYPIVVEDNCFKNKTAKDGDINTDYITNDTKMYKFLEKAVADYKDYIYTISDVHTSALFITQINGVRPSIEYLPSQNSEGKEEYVGKIATERTDEGRYRGTIEYKVKVDRENSEEDNIEFAKRVYLDMNYDGVFSQAEIITSYTEESTERGSLISIDFPEVSFGIIPWKIEVSGTNNKNWRDSIQGYFTIVGEGEIPVRVLQVLDDLDDETANLQFLYEDTRNSLLKYYLQGAETLLQTQFEIETLTPGQLEAQLVETNGRYLKDKDVLVLGLGDNASLGETVLNAINRYISDGGSVLIAALGASEESGRLGFTGDALDYLGQLDKKSYVNLGRESGELYRYSGLEAEMFYEKPNLRIENINDGVMAVYPYQIDQEASLGPNTQVTAPDYLLDIADMTDSGQVRTTAWFTLNENGEDKNAYNVSPRDAMNNYYVYSRGNVVYVGQSRYPYIYEPDSGKIPEGDGVEECKIFVNALIAAYNGGVHASRVFIVAGFTSTSEIESVTIPFDVEIKNEEDPTGGILDETVDVYFKFTDNNIAFDKVTDISFYYKNGGDPEASLIHPEGGISDGFEEFKSQIWMVENNRLVEVTGGLKQGKVYRIKAPVVALQTEQEETADIYVLLTTHYTRSGQEMTMLSEDSIALTRAQMFLLE